MSHRHARDGRSTTNIARCSFVPPHVLDRLARSRDAVARDNARSSVQQSEITRTVREATRIGIDEFIVGSAPGLAPQGAVAAADRTVFDCEQKWETQVTEVRSEGGAPTGDADADGVYDHAGEVASYVANVLERDSLDNAGMGLLLNVHYGVDYMNAFWDGTQMTFGDGDGQIFTSFAASLDVVAHELFHGITQFTANLEYRGQSGALNEHFSDVFGSVITQLGSGQDAGTADWLIGDEIMGPTLFGEALRSMKAPGTAYDNPLMGRDPQPAHMDDAYTGTADNGGVHINSGIPNRAFYLVATDIGTPTAGIIWYRALQALWPTAAFSDAVEVIVEESRHAVNAGDAQPGTPQVVRAAFREVGLYP